MSYCENTTIEVFIPIQLNEELENLYKKLLDQGYNLFDPDDSFYRDLCTPYESENGTDVLLDDRISYYYNKVYNDTTCPQNCNFMSYSTETKYLKCECSSNVTDIVTLDVDNLNKENVYKSFYSTLKYSNWKVMLCYKLVFNFKIFCHNYGSILTLILFIIYLLFMLYYSLKDISPLKLAISKILFKETELEKKNSINFKSEIDEKNKKIKNKTKAPPKRLSAFKTKETKEDLNEPKNTENFEFIEDNTNKRKKIKNKTNNKMKRNVKKKEKRKTKNEKNSKDISIKFSNIENKNESNNVNNVYTIDAEFDENEVKTRDSTSELKKGNKELNNIILDNFELNNLEYDEAVELDKRGFCKTYWSVLLREHSAFLTFVACHDYNLFYVKFERFIILFCTDMTMNGLFFSHESMHHLYVNNGEYSFVQQSPQILYSLIVSHILEVFLCYLSMTDTSVYQIKGLSKEEKSGEKILDIIECMKKKLVGFFVFTFFLFLFYWYFISAFCAVYHNTQKIFLRDSLTSFITSMIDPFLIYGVTMILRLSSLSCCCRKKCGCLYKISDLIPIF